MKHFEARLVCPSQFALGEGPVWWGGDLYGVNIEGRALWRLAGGTEARPDALEMWSMPERVGFAVPAAERGFVVGLESGFYRLYLEGSEARLAAIVDPEADKPTHRMNDGKVDPRGRLFAGTLNMKFDGQPRSALYRLDADGACDRVLDGVKLSNGLAWNAAADTFYYIDTPLGRVDAFDFDTEAGTLSKRRTVVTLPDDSGSPDGMCIDAEDHLWVAHWGGAQVSRWNPATGEQVARVDVGSTAVTSCCFGGPDLRTLYITTARIGATPEVLAEYPEAGGLFACDVGVTGTACVPWGG